MFDIDTSKIRRLDATVLLVFVGLMRHRKATTVADALGLTQSAISHALKRLRDIFDDPLFLRKPHGLEPTAVAVALEPQLRLVIETLDRSLAGPEPFDPAKSARTVRIAAYDYELATVIPQIIAHLEGVAPNMHVAALPLGRAAALAALAGGEIDLALGFFWDAGQAFLSDTLYEERYRVVARDGHPLFRRRLTPKTYAAARHLVVSPAGDLTGIVDRSLASLGLSRRVTAAVPLFFPALASVACSDLIATLPSRLVERFADSFGLESRPPPIAIRPFAVSCIRHRRDEKSSMHAWLLDAIRAASKVKGGSASHA